MNKTRVMKIKGDEYKLQAFTDNIVFILEDPELSKETLMDKIKEYGKVAGLIINWEKTKLLTKNMQEEKARNLARESGLRLEKKVKYLGINMSNKCGMIMPDNYLRLMKEIQQDLEKWKTLHILDGQNCGTRLACIHLV